MLTAAFLDACVLYPAYLRDTLLRLAAADLYRPLWSAEVLTELRRNLDRLGLPPAGVERTIRAMREAFGDAEIEGYESLVPAMTCDPKDRHVLAAAVHGRADLVVTFNLRDFPETSMAPHGVEVQNPDVFLLDLLDLHPAPTVQALQRQVAGYKRSPQTLPGLLAALAKAGAPHFADNVRRHYL